MSLRPSPGDTQQGRGLREHEPHPDKGFLDEKIIAATPATQDELSAGSAGPVPGRDPAHPWMAPGEAFQALVGAHRPGSAMAALAPPDPYVRPSRIGLLPCVDRVGVKRPDEDRRARRQRRTLWIGPEPRDQERGTKKAA